MTSTALAQGIAELLSLSTGQQKAALSDLSAYKTQEANDSFFCAPPPGLPPMSSAPSLNPMTVAPTAAIPRTAPPMTAAPTGAYFHAKSSNKIPHWPSRRGSAASTAPSTRAGGSSVDSVDSLLDCSDAASQASSPFSRRASAVSVTMGEPLKLHAEPLKLHAQAPSATCRSTLKLANIPRRCGKEELLAAIEAVGFGDAYDFFYLPLGPQSKKNHGYAFINFKNNEMADQFSRAFVGYPIRAKLLDVAPAPLQGLQANMEHFSKTQATKSGWMPNVVLKV